MTHEITTEDHGARTRAWCSCGWDASGHRDRVEANVEEHLTEQPAQHQAT